MTRTFYDRTLGREVRVPSKAELQVRTTLEILKDRGIDVHDIHCACCGLRLTELTKIKFNTSGPIGPECSKHPHLFPCRRHLGAAR